MNKLIIALALFAGSAQASLVTTITGSCRISDPVSHAVVYSGTYPDDCSQYGAPAQLVGVNPGTSDSAGGSFDTPMQIGGFSGAFLNLTLGDGVVVQNVNNNPSLIYAGYSYSGSLVEISTLDAWYVVTGGSPGWSGLITGSLTQYGDGCCSFGAYGGGSYDLGNGYGTGGNGGITGSTFAIPFFFGVPFRVHVQNFAYVENYSGTIGSGGPRAVGSVSFTMQARVTQVTTPEPATGLLLLSGGIGFAFLRRRYWN